MADDLAEVARIAGVAGLVRFARELRARGVLADPSRVHTMVQAMQRLDGGRSRDIYWAGRLTLCATAEDLPHYDAAYAACFGEQHADHADVTAAAVPRLHLVSLSDDATDADDAPRRGRPGINAASRVEVLRRRDIAEVPAAHRAELARLLASLTARGDVRRTRRLTAASSGGLDPRRSVREIVRCGGELVALPRRTRSERPHRIVVLLDVSGSMAAYADALLRFAHVTRRATRATRTEVFTLGTRLTRVTRELAERDPDEAMRAVMRAVPDWSGGTRLGELLKEFIDGWGNRGMARGAVIVVMSDGWERGDVTLLGEQMARLRRLAHRIVWANPRVHRPGFAPVATGMAAALPYVDDLVAGHTVDALDELAAVISRARKTHAHA
jgi:uncharacterized protein